MKPDARRCVALLAAMLLSGCATMSPTQKRVATVAVAVVVVGTVMAHQDQPPSHMAIPTAPNCGAGVCR